MKKKTILIGMTNLGAGHKQSASSIANAIREKYGDSNNIKIIDVFSEGKTLIDPIFKKGYRYFSNHFTFIYAVFYYFTNVPFIYKLFQKLFSGHTVKQISKLIAKMKPDIIVSTYPVFPEVFYRACKRTGHDAKIIALILDYETGHNSWLLFHEVDSFLISSDECYNKALKLGVKKEQIIRVGIPLALKFSRKIEPGQTLKLRESLGCTGDNIMVLVAGGGEGLENAYSILKHILDSGIAIHPVVVCGRNKALKKKLSKLVAGKEEHATILGFVNNMYELMNAADIIVSKSGYLTICEALFIGKPLLIASYVPGQERGNMEFVIKNKAGYYIPNSRKLVDKISHLTGNKEELSKLSRNVKKLNLQSGTREIADIIVKKM